MADMPASDAPFIPLVAIRRRRQGQNPPQPPQPPEPPQPPQPPGAATTRTVIDPVTRIEGHLRIEADVQDGKVSKAWSMVPLYRGIETILKGRDPRDAPLITQRLCGVCTYIHQLCSIRAIEHAVGLAIPDNARIVRNLMNGALFVHDHIVHFYHLHAMDWVDVTSALSASPSATTALAQSISPSAKAFDFAAVKTRLATFVDSGQLGPFANAYWGHSAYRLSPEENLLLAAHYLDGLNIQVKAGRLMAILGGKNPHPQSAVVGGVTCGAELNSTRLATFRALLAEVKSWVETIYKPDMILLAQRYPEWLQMGGNANFLAYGEFPLTATEPSGLFLPRGVLMDAFPAGGPIASAQPLDVTRITEHVARSWYQGATPLHPSVGETLPNFTGRDVNGRYSWSKSPRYGASVMEVGPLARVLVAYSQGHQAIGPLVDAFISDMPDLPPTAPGGLPVAPTVAHMNSTMGRVAARMIETVALVQAMDGWVQTLLNNFAVGSTTIFKSSTPPKSATGYALNEAPRGALGHWLNVDANGKIANYQMVVPSTWNFGPRDAAGTPGAVENALLGAPTADPDNPLEMLRVVHSFDPCIACGVHVIKKEGE